MGMKPFGPLHYPAQPFHRFLQDTADRFPERTAIRCGSDQLSFRELDGWVNATARAFVQLGVQPGDRVAVVLPNRIEWLMALLGAHIVGAAVVTANPSWMRPELEHALNLTKPRVVVADRAIGEVLDGLGHPDFRICVDDNPPSGWLSLWQLLASPSGQRLDDVVDDWGSLDAVLPFSSGTTGLPKAVRHTHSSLVSATVSWKSAARIGDSDSFPFFLPLFHIYGLVTIGCVLSGGASMTLLPRFDVETLLQILEAEHSTICFAVAPVALALAQHADLERYNLSHLRYLVWAATPMVEHVAQRVSDRTGVPWLQGYGATEVPVITAVPAKLLPGTLRIDTPGLPIPDIELQIRDLDTREVLPAGATGEILARGPSVMAGYLPEDANGDAFEDGWVRTGDVGWMESEGWLHITDRAKEMIKVNGFQVAPAELEQVLLAHPGVLDCGVYGLPDEKTGEAPEAAVVARDGWTPNASELLAWMEDQVARYKRLRAVNFVDAVPRTPSGKILRRTLRDAARASKEAAS